MNITADQADSNSTPNHSVDAKVKKQKKLNYSKYIILNQGTVSKEKVEKIQKAHSQLMDKDHNGFVKNVKFNNLRYELNTLFEDLPPFNEPVPIFSQIYDFIPESLGTNSKKVDGVPAVERQISQHEKNRQNNLAYANLN